MTRPAPRRRGFGVHDALLEPEILVEELDDVPALGEPIEQGGGERLVAKDLSLLVERRVGSDYQKKSRVPACFVTGKAIGPRFGDRRVTELVDDQEFLFLGLLDEPWQGELILGGQHVIYCGTQRSTNTPPDFWARAARNVVKAR